MKKSFLFVLTGMIVIQACGGNRDENNENKDTIAAGEIVKDVPVTTSIEINASQAGNLLDTTAVVEELGKGFIWSEGPVWVDALDALLFSDVPANKIYKWSEKDGLTVFLEPSGKTNPNDSASLEGSNGLSLDSEGDLILCQHGDRRIASLTSGVENPQSSFITMAGNFDGKKFNSPNDLAIKSNGDIYFTDPSYGLKDKSKREIDFHGVYKLTPGGVVSLLLDSLSWPNGIAFSPDEKTLYLANSDKDKAVWYNYKIDANGKLKDGKILYDATKASKNGEVGLPDGMKVHKDGTIFATGPGGIYLISPKGEKLGRIKTSKATANCAFDKDQKYLYMTTTDRLLRLKLK